MVSERDSATERWLPVPGFEGLYEVSDQGRVRSLERTVTVSGRSDGQKSKLNDGRPVVNLCGREARRVALVHHLVLEAFVGPCPAGQECRHLDDNRQHNALVNLEWGTRRENMADRRRNGLRKRGARGEVNPAAKLTENDVRLIRRLRATGLSFEKIGKRMGVSWQAIRDAVTGRTWGWLDERIDGALLAMEPREK
jgi:hypothetical protein